MTPERVTLEAYLKAAKSHPLYGLVRYPTQKEHIARYRFAAGLATNAGLVVDAPSGAGWGTNLLASVTTGQVIGIDRDDEAIAEAKAGFVRSNLSFTKADLLDSVTLNTLGEVDLMVCFELIEHFNRHEATQFLQNAKACTKTLILSTPNRPLYSPYFGGEGKSANPYHKYEYTFDELQELLHQSGWEVAAQYGQRFVEPDIYKKVAQTLYPLRRAALNRGLPADHKLTVLPLLLLTELSAWISDEYLKPVNGGSKQPVFYTAICKPSG